MSLFGIKNRFAYCLLEDSMVPVVLIWVANPLCAQHPSGPTALLQWDLRARGTDSQDDALVCCWAMRNLSIWGPQFV